MNPPIVYELTKPSSQSTSRNDKYCPKHNGFLELNLPYFVSEGRTALMEYGHFSKLLPRWLKY